MMDKLSVINPDIKAKNGPPINPVKAFVKNLNEILSVSVKGIASFVIEMFKAINKDTTEIALTFFVCCVACCRYFFIKKPPS